MSEQVDVDAYAARVGYSGERTPTIEALREIVACHVHSIAFENLSVLSGEGVQLDAASSQGKLIRTRRGGYCFEQNGLLGRVLTAMGFAVETRSARVRIQSPREFTPPRTHLFLVVTIDGVRWLTDVGVGGLTPTAPLLLDSAEEQATPHETHRIMREGGGWFHQARLGEAWADVYEFTGEAMPRIDQEVANWWTSTNPGSKFRQNLMASRAGPGGTRVGMQNRTFTRRRGGTVLETFEVGSREQLVEVLRSEFGLDVPEGARLEAPGLVW